MINRMWLHPPLAFARVGSSKQPCESFYWGPDDLSPEGTARTRIVPMKSLKVEDDGSVTDYDPPADPFVFKDGDAFRPVCPFFELHAEWEIKGEKFTGPLTEDVLGKLGIELHEFKWRVNVDNLKAFYLTKSIGDQVRASVEISGDSHGRQELEGTSPTGSGVPLVPEKLHIPLGSVQVIKPSDKFPELRLRFTPPAGKVYAPEGIAKRLEELPQLPKTDPPSAPAASAPPSAAAAAPSAAPAARAAPDPMAELNEFLLQFNDVWREFKLPLEQCLLDPRAAWPSHKLITGAELRGQRRRLATRLAELNALRNPGDGSELIRMLRGPRSDVGSMPASIFAFAFERPMDLVSVGMIDDTGDGTISVELPARGERPARDAMARVVIAPPSYAPDRRLPVSIADGLIDRVGRKPARKKGWVTGDNRATADAEVADLLDRAYETAGLQNIDALADFAKHQNRVIAVRQGTPLSDEEADERLWHGEKLVTVEPLPLTAAALQRHRRNTARLVFEMFALEAKHWFKRTMRKPVGPDRFYDKRMPGLMCGFDRRPLHLTRRQYELLQRWSEREPESAEQPQSSEQPKP